MGTALANSIDTLSVLERRHVGRGLSREEARLRIAEGLRIGIGTLERLMRKRVKKIDADTRDRVTALFIRDLEQDLARLSHELGIARLASARHDESEVLEIEACLQKARAALEKLVGG